MPTGFAPTEDQGYLLVNVQLPDAASRRAHRRGRAPDREDPARDARASRPWWPSAGAASSPGVNGPNVASLFPRLTPWSKRKTPELQAGRDPGPPARAPRRHPGGRRSWSSRRRRSGASAPAAGSSSSCRAWPAARCRSSTSTARKIMDAARQRPELAATFTGFRPGVPQLDAQVDRAKAKALGVPLSDVFSSLQIFLGSLYVNDFNAFGRVYRVQLQAEPSFRASPERRRAALRAEPARGERPARADGAAEHARHREADHRARHHLPLQPLSLGRDRRRHRARRQLRPGHRGHAGRWRAASCRRAWPTSGSGLAFQEIEAGSRAGFVFALSALFVFLVLAAQYESWLVPLAVILAVPLGVLGALGALWLERARQRRVRPDRSRAAHRAGEQERHPHRGVRQGAPRARGRDPGGGARGRPPALPAHPDDVVRLHPGLAAAGLRVGRGRGQPATRSAPPWWAGCSR